MNLIPKDLYKYFWDTKTKILPIKNPGFVIERILEYGDEKALSWLDKNIDKKTIIDTLTNSKKISPKTGNFFALYYGIDRNKLLCIRKPFTQKQNRF